MAYIGRDPNDGIVKTSVIHRYTATAAQTAFTGADVNGNSLEDIGYCPTGNIKSLKEMI